MAQITKIAAKARFEAGDRPTDQDFSDLFDSILFLGTANLNGSGTETSISNDFSVGGILTTTGTFVVNNEVMFGKLPTEENLNKPLQVYGAADETMVFVSGSVSDVMFEGVSGDATSSIKLSDNLSAGGTNVRFGTHTGKAFIEVAGNEILNISSSNGTHDNRIYMSGSVGIGTTSPSQKLHVKGSDHTAIQVDSSGGTDKNAFIKLTNDARSFSLKTIGSNNHLYIVDETAGTNPFKLTGGSPSNSLVLNNGKVGMGTDSPGETLEVIGNISASGHISASGLAIPGSNVNISDGDVIASRTGSFAHLRADTISGSHRGDGSGLTGISSTQIALFGGSIVENNLVTINAAQTGIDGEANLNFSGTQLRIGPAAANAGVDVHINHNATSDAVLLLESDGSSNDSTVALRQQGTWPSAATGVDLVYDGGSDWFMMKGYTAAGGLQGEGFKYKPETDDNTLVLTDGGKVGINNISPTEALTVKDGNILASGSAYMQIGVNQTDSGEIQMGVTSGTAEGFLKVTSNAAFVPNFKLLQGASAVQMLNVSQSQLTVYDNEGVEGMSLRSLDNITGTTPGLFDGESDVKQHRIYFPAAGGSNDPGMIIHETRGTTDTNQGIIHLCPTDDNSTNDYIAIHGYNDPITNIIDTAGNAYFGNTVHIGNNASYNGHTNILHLNFSNTQVGTTHDQNIGILIENQGGGDAGIEFEVDTGQYFSIFLDQSQEDLLIRDITNSRTLAQFTDAGNIILGHSGDVYGRAVNNKATTLYRFHGLYLTWDSDTYGTSYNHSITSTLGTEATDGYGSDDITINSYGSILINIDSNDNGTEYFKIGHKTTANNNILFTIDETGLITTTNTIKMADVSDYWIATGGSTNWGIYWDTGNNTLEFHGNGTERAYIDLDNGNMQNDGWHKVDGYTRYSGAPGGATAGEVRIGESSDRLKIQSEDGYVEIGAGNTSHMHFYTDRTNYYFNKELRIEGGNFCAYNGDAYLRYRTGGGDYLHITSTYARFVIDGTEQFRATANQINLQGHRAFNIGDTWLRINETSAFTSGIFTGTSLIRTDSTSGIRVGSNSSNKFFAANGHVGINRANGAVYSSTYQTMVMKMKSAKAGFAIENDSNTSYWNNWYGHGNSDVTFGTNSQQLIWSHNGAGQNGGWINATSHGVNQMFTGQHRNIPAVGEVTDYMTKIGYIVSSNGTIQNVPSEDISTHEINRRNINETLPRVKLSEIPKDKKVYGVISELEDPESSGRSFMHGNWGSLVTKPDGDDRLIINSVGEGAIMVCNINGDLENGDYITTSEIPGIGMKQDDDLLHNYTVAKIVQDCNFTQNQQYVVGSITHNGVVYKTALVGCTYHCG